MLGLLLAASISAPPPAPPVREFLPPCPPVRVEKTAKAITGYPIRGSLWTGCPDWTHLTKGEHAGKFPTDWLKTLTAAEVQSLHSDDHEGRVKWQYVPKTTPPPTVTYSLPQSQSSCPGGNCPQSVPLAPRWRGLFR